MWGGRTVDYQHIFYKIQSESKLTLNPLCRVPKSGDWVFPFWLNMDVAGFVGLKFFSRDIFVKFITIQ